MKRQRILVFITLIIAFTVTLTLLPIQSLYPSENSNNHEPVWLDSNYYNSHGYICGTNQHWAKYVFPDCSNFVEANENSCANMGPFRFDDDEVWLPPYFTIDNSIITAIEIMTVSGDYKKVNLGESDDVSVYLGNCVWGLSYYNDEYFFLELLEVDGTCCWHMDWIKVWYTGKTIGCPEEEPEPWVRGDRDMVCYQVWVNDDGCFELAFWWEYADNNWVKIYDMEGNMVWETDMPYGEAEIEVCLPDGMYLVKTFHDQPEPLQEFYIGKPVPADMDM